MKKKRSYPYGVLLAVAGVLMMCIGILRGEAGEIFSKAISICLECIGIG